MRDSASQPPVWTSEQFERDRARAIDSFIANWGRTPRYLELAAELKPRVEEFFQLTDDVRQLDAERLIAHPELIHTARYLAAPVLSKDDLCTLARSSVAPRQVRDQAAVRIAAVLRASLDPVRCPWLYDPVGVRMPTPQERESAIVWTAGLWAANRVATESRTEPATLQEARTADALRAAGFVQVPCPGEIVALDQLARGQFTTETRLAGATCDIPVRLRDGRLLAIECKVSNSGTNSVKRLNREIGGKAAGWIRSFGERQVIPAAVLAGVFNLGSLRQAQDEQHVTVFWDHSLDALQRFVQPAPED